MAEGKPNAAIFITGKPGAYTVGIVPAPPDDPSGEFDTYQQAYGFAVGLRMTTGLGIADLSIHEDAPR